MKFKFDEEFEMPLNILLLNLRNLSNLMGITPMDKLKFE